jgi:hypothetical protein
MRQSRNWNRGDNMPSIYSRLKDLGLDHLTANKLSRRKDWKAEGEYRLIQAEEMMEKYNDKKVVGDLLSGSDTSKWKAKQINNFIRGEEKERQFYYGEYTGQLTKEEKQIIKDEVRSGNVERAMELSKKQTIDYVSREKEWNKNVGRGKKPSQAFKREWRNLEKQLGADEKYTPVGLMTLREKMLNNRTELGAIDYIKMFQDSVNPNRLSMSPK